MEIAKNRILNFEKEYHDSINKLKENEKDMKQITELRRKWLEDEEISIDFEFELFQKKIEILEKEMEIIQAKLVLDQYKLEGYYEGLQLQHLIQSTKPFQSNDRERNGKNEIIKNNLAEMLQDSIIFRQHLNNDCKSLQNKLQLLISEYQTSEQVKKSLYEKLLSDFNSNISNLIHHLKANLSKVIEESLILRHNCRIASSVLAEHHQNHVLQLSKLKESLRSFNQYYQDTLNSYESSLQHELDLSLQTKRKQLMKYEQSLDDITLSDETKRLKISQIISTYSKDINRYKKKYEQLQAKRYEEIEKRQTKLSDMRRDISTAQSILLNPPQTYPSSPTLLPPRIIQADSFGPITPQQSPKHHPRDMEQHSRNQVEEDNDIKTTLDRIKARLSNLKEYEQTHSLS